MEDLVAQLKLKLEQEEAEEFDEDMAQLERDLLDGQEIQKMPSAKYDAYTGSLLAGTIRATEVYKERKNMSFMKRQIYAMAISDMKRKQANSKIAADKLPDHEIEGAGGVVVGAVDGFLNLVTFGNNGKNGKGL